jgi:alpha-glucosidase
LISSRCSPLRPRCAIATAALCTLLLFAHSVRARTAGGPISPPPAGVAVRMDGGILKVIAVRDDVLRIHFLPRGRSTPVALVMSPRAPRAAAHPVRVSRVGGKIVLATRRMQVVLDTSGRWLRVFVPGAPHALLSEPDLATLAHGTVALRFAPPDAALYGVHDFDAFQAASSGLLRTGRQLATAGEQGDAGAPFVWSTAGFGVLIDSQKTLFDLAAGTLRVASQSRPDADFYLIAGDPKRIFAAVAKLTGHAPLFPKWSFGFINSQWGIDEGELLRIVRRYRRMGIPLDAFALDFDWKAWGRNDYGEFRWNRRKFPDGPSGKLHRELSKLGVHLIGIMKPRIHLDTIEGRYATAHHLWMPGEKPTLDYFSHELVENLDFDDPATRRWFFNPALEHSFETGIVGWWNDEADETGDDEQFFNMERALYDGQRAFTSRRVWSLNRNFWLGAQRYAYGLWSGDIESGFASMAAQRQRMLSAADVGEMWWGMDGGGFHHHPSSENFARWIEFDAFAPICRVHGDHLQRRQVWLYGQTATQAATAALDLRYRLLPYIYSYAWRDHVAGVGLVRPLTFSWPRDPNVRNDVSSWMFGKWLLVSPVVHRHQTEKQVYLPAGTWTEYFTGKVYAGGRTVAFPTDSKTWADIPLFIRQGAIIPSQPPMQYVGQHRVTTLSVGVFPARRATHFDYYDDDGATYGYEQGRYFLQRLAAQALRGDVRLWLATARGSYRPALRHYLFAVHRVRARAVRVDGRPLGRAAGRAALRRCARACWVDGHDRFGPVTYLELPAGHALRADIEVDGR